ncbi:MAG: hypothetical protein HOB20_06220 [Planctomycetaceae bacterium]|jgi:hypothetical protein|nr:hypothetical protein [Planctomycetaceae bacterium]
METDGPIKADIFRQFTSEMIDATKQMVADCNDLTEWGFADSKYFQNEFSFDFDKLVHRVTVDGESSFQIVSDVIALLERCNCHADTIWFCEGSLGDLEYEYTPDLGEIWFVTGTEEEALEKIRATVDFARQMETT